ncbi:hypothetical protein VTO42DRAFT_6239 [Malbranchea cinnamomea]
MVESYQTTVNAVSWTLASLSTLLVASRLYSRSALVQKFGWDDAFMLAALALALTTTVMVSVGISYGFGLHVYDIPDPERRAQAIKWTMIPPAICLMSTALSKISVMLFLIRLLGLAANLVHKIILYSATTLMVGGNILAIVVLLAFCTPREKAWRPEIPGKCMDPRLLDVAGRTVTVYNAAMDLLYAGFAVALVWTLNMKTSTKWGLAVLMSGGVFGTAASIVKAAMMGTVTDTVDMTWAWAPISIWYTAEMYVIIMAGSIPMLRPLWAFLTGKPYGSSDKYTPSAQGYSKQIDGKSAGRSRGQSSSVPGMFTIALRDMSDDDQSGGGASRGSSSADILPKSEPDKQNIRRSQNGIHVVTDVEVGYEGMPRS